MLKGFCGLLVACVHSFLLIRYHGIAHPCALVSWYSVVGDQPCPDTRMWKVKPDLDDLGNPMLDIIHLDSILHNAHRVFVRAQLVFLTTLLLTIV